MFKRMLSAFGVGGPSVDTVLTSPHVTPGQEVAGEVRIQGGTADAEIGQIVLSLTTRVETEHGDHEVGGMSDFHRVVLAQAVRVPADRPVTVPFRLAVPWETPITAVGNAPLPRMTVGVRTELVIDGAPDKGDLDPLHVHPLPSQDRVLDAFGVLGFQFRSADVEAGRLNGVRQELGFYQELEFFPPARFAGRVTEVELTFVASQHELFVVLEADRRGGLFRSGGDTFGHFRMTHEEALSADWAALVDGWLEQVAGRLPAGNPAFGHGDSRGHRRGPGMGGVVAGAAAGMVGGMVLGEMVSDAGDLGEVADLDFGDLDG